MGVLGRRRLPAETPGRAFLSHAFWPGQGHLRPGGDGSSITTTPGAELWGRAKEGHPMGRGRGLRIGGACRERPAQGSLLLRNIPPFLGEPPTRAVLEPRSRPRTHSQFLNQHHLPGTPSQLLPLPPPPLPPPTAPARPRLPDYRAARRLRVPTLPPGPVVSARERS